MNKVILVQENDSVVVLAPINLDVESVAATIPNSNVVDVNTLPTREWRDALTIDGGVDLEKAKEIWRKKLRKVRDQKLKKLDVEWMKAMERGEVRNAASIAVNKQILRDLPGREEIANAESLQDLKNFWPSVLEA